MQYERYAIVDMQHVHSSNLCNINVFFSLNLFKGATGSILDILEILLLLYLFSYLHYMQFLFIKSLKTLKTII